MATCNLCGNDVDSLHHEAEQIVLNMIKRMNPDWVESDGACEKCIEYYNNLDDEVQVKDEQPDN